MKKLISGWTAIVLTLLLLSGCKKSYHVDYSVYNDDIDGIFIVFQRTATSPLDTSYLSPGQHLILHSEMGEKANAVDYVLDIEQLPFENINVQNSFGTDMTCDENEVSCWSRINNKDKKFGEISLIVVNSSF